MIKIVLILDLIVSLLTAGMVNWVDEDYSYLYNNYDSVAELGDKTLNDVFIIDYKDTPISTLNDNSLNEVFEEGNILTFNFGMGYEVSDVVFANNSVTFKNKKLTTGFVGITPVLSANTYNYYVRYSIVGTIGEVYYHAFGNNSYFTVNLTEQNQIVTRKVNTTKGNRSYFEVWVVDDTAINNTHSFNDIYLINMNDLGIGDLTVGQMDHYYDAYISDDILLEAFNDYNDLELTQDDLDYYYDLYLDNLEREMQMNYTINELDVNDLVVVMLWLLFYIGLIYFFKWVI